ncbi:MAG: Co2+/Mg2+ efflux protein ApaG [Candidatus Kapabacteria bacterium]|nr:Co2+/Mg2+ efflux protein ApaG [Ignavibacteriota bacterium]MCW5885667.1 Co2+/Mg2+ efflux protein ApaG [Candidatus Kapabacteria bacterium]
MNTSSDVTTNGIRVRVFPQYIPASQTPGDGRYYFAYTVIISNVGSDWAKLLSRHWIIINSEGDPEEVIGEGVVGYFPELNPGESFTYTSFCPLNTEWGTMEGEYQFVGKSGEMFVAKIGRFYLVNSTDIEVGE